MNPQNDKPPANRIAFSPDCYHSRKRARREALWRIFTSPWMWAGFILGMIVAIAMGCGR